MSKQDEIEYRQLQPGYEFPASSHKLDSSIVAAYLNAVEETSPLYRNTKLVPPMAVAAYAMASLSERLSLPPGSLHVSQELEFVDTVNVGDTITCRARVIQNKKRGRLHLMVINFDVFHQSQKKVLAGKTSFVLPEYDEDNRP